MNWIQIDLGKLLKIKHGWAFKGDSFADVGKYILLSPGNFYPEGGLKLKGEKEKFYDGDFPEDYLLKKDDVLIVMTDLVNTAPILGGSLRIKENNRFLHNQRLGLVEIIDKDKIEIDFLYHLFNSPYYRGMVRGSATGVTVRHTAPERIYKINVKIPSTKDEQKKIGSILNSYDDLIENNLRRIELLEKSAHLLYKEWFVNLHFPGYDHTKITDSMPEGWERKKLSELAEIIMGQSPKSVFYNENGDGLPFHQGVRDYGSRFVETRIYSKAGDRIANQDDILFSVRAPVGRINLTLDKIIIGRGLAALKSKTENQSFLYYQLKNHFFKENMIGVGVIYASVNKDQLKSQEILTPDSNLINLFEKYSTHVDFQIENLSKQNKNLIKARDLLLPKIMNGEIEV